MYHDRKITYTPFHDSHHITRPTKKSWYRGGVVKSRANLAFLATDSRVVAVHKCSGGGGTGRMFTNKI